MIVGSKNTVKRVRIPVCCTAIRYVCRFMSAGRFVSAAEDMGIFSQTAIVADAGSVGKVTDSDSVIFQVRILVALL